jgi:hypothetical protein
MTDVLKATQATIAARKPPAPEGRKLDAADRREATNSADAKKARAVVRDLSCGSLPLICTTIAKHTSDLKMKHALEEAFDRFAVANGRYMREELKDENKLIEWMGPHGPGLMPTLPPGSPEHKVELAAAWNQMLMAVNEATKVGVHKAHREHPITLKIDLEEPDNTPRIITPDSIEWN